MKQTNLFGKVLTPKIGSGKEDYECCEACYTAKEKVCVCRCHGAFHGLGNPQSKRKKDKAKIDESYEFYLPEEEAQRFRKQFTDTKCLCGYDLKDEPLVYYKKHDAGWKIKGEDEKVWIYVKCPSCGYDMAIWKMGVPRE